MGEGAGAVVRVKLEVAEVEDVVVGVAWGGRKPWRSPQMNSTRISKIIMQKPCKPEPRNYVKTEVWSD